MPNNQSDYQRVSELIEYISASSHKQPTLEDLSRIVQLSPFHLQKMFKRWTGISPKQFLKLATLKNAKAFLLQSQNLLEASDNSGLSSSSRLYDHFVTIEAITPGEFKSGGRGLHFYYGEGASPFGAMFIAWTERGIHQLTFEDTQPSSIQTLKNSWPHASFHENKTQAKKIIGDLFSRPLSSPQKLTLLPAGTNFQMTVWRALLSIPHGSCISYGELAKFLGKPKAARAVGHAVGANPIALLIPCHRVLQASGCIGGYRWGKSRKKIILTNELATSEVST